MCTHLMYTVIFYYRESYGSLVRIQNKWTLNKKRPDGSGRFREVYCISNTRCMRLVSSQRLTQLGDLQCGDVLTCVLILRF